MLTQAHDARLDVHVRGDLGRLPKPPPAVVETLRSHALPTLAHAESIVITGLGDPEHGSLIVHLSGLSAHPPERQGAPIAGVEVISDEDGWWMEVSWSAAVAQPTAATS
jgi:hypothetical protein